MNLLSQRFLLDVFACGAVCIRERGTPMNGGLPVFSTETRAEAEALRVLHCRLERDHRGTYRLNNPPKGVEDLTAIGEMFATSHARRITILTLTVPK